MAFIRSKTRNGRHGPRVYYYIVENRWIDGKVRQKTLEYIGTLDDLKKMAFKSYESSLAKGKMENVEDLNFQAYEHGAEMGLFWCAERIGIEAIMDEVFPPKTIKGLARSRILLLGMIHRAVDPGSKSEFQAWAAATSLPYHLQFDPEELDSQAFWEAMDGITQDQIKEVWQKLIQRLCELFHVDLRKFHLDYSNYFTFIDSKNGRCVICKRGHNKQKRDDLRQFSLALLTSWDLLVPLVWDPYEGNRNDKTEFPEFTGLVKNELSKLGIPLEEVTISFDGGSNSEENFKDLGVHFVCSHSLTGLKHLYDIDADSYETVELSDGHERKAYRVDDLVFSGVDGTGVLTLSEALQNGQRKELEKDLKKALEACEEMTSRLANPKSRLFSDLKKAQKKFEADQKAALDYNKGLEEELRKRQAEGKTHRGRQKKPKPIPEWDEEKVLLEMVSEQVFNRKKYISAFVTVTLEKDSNGARRVSVQVDEEQKEAYCHKYFGKKLTVTDHKNWTTKEILEEYCNQECIETGIFRVSKDPDHFSIRPVYHWTDDKIRVHVFLCLAAIVIAEVLRKEMEEKGIKITKHRMLDRLKEIHDGWVICGEKAAKRVVEKLEGLHKEMWDVILAMRETS